MKVYLDGNIISNPNPSLLEPKFSFRRSTETEEPSISFTGDLNFTGDDYNYIYGKLVTGANAIQEKIILKFVDDCCDDKEYLFQIKPESLVWCNGSCEIQANAVEFSIDSEAYACLNNTMIWDNHKGFQNLPHPRIAYCLEFRPSILQDLAIILAFFTFVGTMGILGIIITSILPLFGLVNLIITAINAIPGINLSTIKLFGTDDPIKALNYGNSLVKAANTFVIGCGYNHPSPFVRSYVNNVCNKCGIKFQSSILNNPAETEYFKLVYFSAQIKEGQNPVSYGSTKVKTLNNYMMVNKPIHNGKTFLDEVKQPFNARWDIHNGVLRFERQDFFKKQTPWLDVTVYDPKKIISVCYEWTKKPRPAYGDFSYQIDGIDWVGDEARERWSDVVEWNSPPKNNLQKGEFKKTFPFGAARFRGDGVDRDVLSDYKWMPLGFGDAIKANEDVMIMNNGTAMLPKLLILRDGTSLQHALVENKYGTFADNIDTFRDTGYPNQPYNYPMWVREGLVYGGSNLYDKFWKIENPRNSDWSGFDVTVKLQWDCATLNAADIDGTILVDKGLVKVEKIDLDFEKGVMTIKGTV